MITLFTLFSGIPNPWGIATGSDGNVWFTELNVNAGKIGRITTAGALTEFDVPPPVPPNSSLPYGITPGPDGNLWFTDELNGRVGRITTSGSMTLFPVRTNAEPHLITAGPDGNIWFTEFAGNDIGRIRPDGLVTEFPIPTAGSRPEGIVTGADGNLWFTESAGNKIGRITAGSSAQLPVPGLGRLGALLFTATLAVAGFLLARRNG